MNSDENVWLQIFRVLRYFSSRINKINIGRTRNVLDGEMLFFKNVLFRNKIVTIQQDYIKREVCARFDKNWKIFVRETPKSLQLLTQAC